MGILPIIFAFSGGNVADSYHDNPPFSVHLSNNIAWANSNVNRDFYKIWVMIHILGGVIHVFVYHSVVGYVLAYGTSAMTHSVIHI